MCIHVFSPGCTLHIENASETIVLSKDGGYEIALEILFSYMKGSKDELGDVHLIYPSSNEGYIRDNLWDATSDLLSLEDNKRTVRDHEYGSHLVEAEAIAYGEQHKCHINPQCKQLVRFLPDPSNLKRKKPLFGNLCTKSTIRSQHDLLVDRYENLILDGLGFSMVKLEFEVPVKKNENRWLRIRLDRPRAYRNLLSGLEVVTRRFLSIMKYNYQILSPKEIQDNLLETTEILGQVCIAKEHGIDESVCKTAQHLGSVLEDKFADSTHTKYKELRINLLSSKAGRLNNIFPVGEIVTNRDFPKFIRRKGYFSKTYTIYQWKTGLSVNGKEEPTFRINFEAMPYYLFNGVTVSVVTSALAVLLILFKELFRH